MSLSSVFNFNLACLSVKNVTVLLLKCKINKEIKTIQQSDES